MIEENRNVEVVVIGAGITGLTTAFLLHERGVAVQVLEQQEEAGGQMRTHRDRGYTYESGPNTGVLSCPEIVELLQRLEPDCRVEVAQASAKNRLIWKNKSFHRLPSGLLSAIKTPLFTWKDKIGILLEPWRKRGNDINESVGELTRRRLGQSFLDYAIDPFLSGIYAGNPMTLTTRFAFPKLYNLEQEYGSFIRGAIGKRRIPKTAREKLATKEVFSIKGGFTALVTTLANKIGKESLSLGAKNTVISPAPDGWQVTFEQNGQSRSISCRQVITTVGAYELPGLLPFISENDMRGINNLRYAPVVQAVIGVPRSKDELLHAFGGLIPSKEKEDVLGILFPSECFVDRAPQGKALYSFFIGGVRREDLFRLSDEALRTLIARSVHKLLKYPPETEIEILGLFRHEKAIPQYEQNTGERIAAIKKVEKEYPGLFIGGNLIDGVGISDRVKQATRLAANVHVYAAVSAE